MVINDNPIDFTKFPTGQPVLCNHTSQNHVTRITYVLGSRRDLYAHISVEKEEFAAVIQE